MYIREIEIDNFKSFVDKTNIPFLEGFTTISGPNGSGKSNIIDSVLFALGLSTSRTLRAEKLPDLINNNGKKNEAAVRISFAENGSGTHFSITRKIKKSSNGYTGTYYLNDKVSTLGEVHDFLSQYNISPGCYNVMMQGDVTGIINMTPFERRKILDEIAGVAEFDRRIEQAKKELETVEDRVDKSSIILNEIDVRLTQLEEERTQALKYQKLKEEKQGLESKISIVKYFDIKTSMERLHESILDANKSKKDEIKILEENIKNEKDEFNRITSQATSINKTTNENLERRSVLRRNLEAKQDEENVLLKDKMVVDEKISRYQRDIEEAEKEIQKFEET